MKIAWYSRYPSTARQEAELKRLFGDDTELEHRGSPRNGEQLARDFQHSGADECVIVAPLAVLEHVTSQGIRPLWSDMAECDESHPEKDVHLPDGRCFRFVEFRRLTTVELEYADKLEPFGKERPAKIAWLSRHEPREESLRELGGLYGIPTDLYKDSKPFRNAEEIIACIKAVGATDTVLVAPLSVFDTLTKQGIHPIQPKLEDGRVILRRVLSLRMEFEDV